LIKISEKDSVTYDALKFSGSSEWIEIYSDPITDYLSRHQDGSEWLRFFRINN